jgi:ABC-type branched-subunit amino acid transport system ATPase component
MSVLVLEDVSKAFGGVHAVNHLSLTFNRGKITALIGPNGAGKTTVFNLINGFLHPDGGKIFYQGKDIAGLAPWRIARKGIGRLFQGVHLFDRMTVRDNVMLAFQNQSGENALNAVLARWKVMREERFAIGRAAELLDFVRLTDKANELAGNLSYGQQKLLAIVRLLASDANVLLLDEPTAGVSPLMMKNLLDVIDKLATEGKTIAVIEHNMNVVMERADWAYFISEGQVTANGSPSELLNDPTVKLAYIGGE